MLLVIDLGAKEKKENQMSLKQVSSSYILSMEKKELDEST